MKAMWNLMNVMQVLAYIRFLSNWPANIKMILYAVHNAITLEPFVQFMFEYSKSKFDNANDKLSNEELQKVGIEDPNTFRSLGIFALVFMTILILILFYFLLRALHKRLPSVLVTIREKLKKKL